MYPQRTSKTPHCRNAAGHVWQGLCSNVAVWRQNWGRCRLVVAVVAAFRMPLRLRCVLSATLEALAGMGSGEKLRRVGKFRGLARALFGGLNSQKRLPIAAQCPAISDRNSGVTNCYDKPIINFQIKDYAMLSHLDTVEFLVKAASNTNNYLKAGPGDYLSGIGDRQHSTHCCPS